MSSIIRNILMENVVSAAGANGDQERLAANGEFASQFNKLVAAALDLAEWTNSHVSMGGISAAFEAEKKSTVKPIFEHTVEVAKRVLAQ